MRFWKEYPTLRGQREGKECSLSYTPRPKEHPGVGQREGQTSKGTVFNFANASVIFAGTSMYMLFAVRNVFPEQMFPPSIHLTATDWSGSFLSIPGVLGTRDWDSTSKPKGQLTPSSPGDGDGDGTGANRLDRTLPTSSLQCEWKKEIKGGLTAPRYGDEKVYCRHEGEHSQRQRRLGESRVNKARLSWAM